MLDLAIIPSVVLLIFIYKLDKREKEPKKLLWGCFLFGLLSVIPVLFMELGLGSLVEEFFVEGSFAYAVLDGFLVAAFTEELFKYLFLKWKTWKSPDFNCTFDGIVYAVFVSLGFATLENILYVADGGLSIAIMRMFTSIPGHACDAVFMGYFYSKAKQASVEGDIAAEKKNKRLALWIPIIIHGLYDCLISFEEDEVGEGVVIFAILIWLAFVIVQFISSFIIVIIASQKDRYFSPIFENRDINVDLSHNNVLDSKVISGNNDDLNKNAALNSNAFNNNSAANNERSLNLKPMYWVCSCHTICKGNYCIECGMPRIAEEN